MIWFFFDDMTITLAPSDYFPPTKWLREWTAVENTKNSEAAKIMEILKTAYSLACEYMSSHSLTPQIMMLPGKNKALERKWKFLSG